MPTTRVLHVECTSCSVPIDVYSGVFIDHKFVCCYCYERNLHIAVYCEHCGIIPVQQGDKYCNDCVNEIVDSLATQYQESMAVEKGWH